jgi:hypothetical protein
MNKHFDMDEMFKYLVDSEASSVSATMSDVVGADLTELFRLT